MLSVKSYDKAYVIACRTRIASALAALPEDPAPLNEMVVSLDASFVHRMRGQEGKDGNPLNEVRMLADSILTNGAVFAADSTIKFKPEASVTNLAFGEPVALDKATFAKLANAVLAEIESRFP